MTAREFITEIFKAVVLWLLAIIPRVFVASIQFSVFRGELSSTAGMVANAAAVLSVIFFLLGLAVFVRAARRRFRVVGLPAWTAWSPAVLAACFALVGAVSVAMVALQTGDYSGVFLGAAFSAYGEWIVPLFGLVVLAGLLLPDASGGE